MAPKAAEGMAPKSSADTPPVRVDLDISALREDDNAQVEWLDRGFRSTTEWKAVWLEALDTAVADPVVEPARRRKLLTRQNTSGRARAAQEEHFNDSARHSDAWASYHRPSEWGNNYAATEDGTMSAFSPRSVSSTHSTLVDVPAVSHNEKAAMCTVAEALDEDLPFFNDVAEAVVDAVGPVSKTVEQHTTVAADAAAAATAQALVRKGSIKVCDQCFHSFSGFGHTCPTCRKLGPGGLVNRCSRCSGFFKGFGETCPDCVARTSQVSNAFLMEMKSSSSSSSSSDAVLLPSGLRHAHFCSH